MKKLLFFLVGVTCCLESKGQTEMDSLLGKTLVAIYDRQPARVNLFFHQPAYAPGDTAFFQASYLNAETLKPIAGKQLLTLVVNDATGASVVRQSFYVRDGLGSNQLILPADILPGLYRLVCWSNVMRNYDHSLFYQQPLEVVGEKKSVSGRNVALKNQPMPTVLSPLNAVSMVTKISHTGLEVSGKSQVAGGHPLFFLLVKGRKIYFSRKIIPETDQSFSVTLSQAALPLGLFNVLVFDDQKNSLTHRLLFNPVPTNDWTRLTHPLSVGTRSSMEITIGSDPKKQANYSVTVYQSGLFSKSGGRGSVAPLELFNNLEGTAYSEGRLIPLDSINYLNDYLATQQWKAFSWDSAAKGLVRKANFAPESSLSIKGKIFNKTTGELLPAPTFVTFYFENSTFVQGIYADKDGSFKLDLQGPIEIREKAYYKVDFKEQELTDAVMQIQEEGYSFPANKSEKTEEYDPYFNYINIKRSAEFSFNHGGRDLKKLGATQNPNRLLEEETLGVDVEYRMSEYKVFNSMQEIAVEILPRVVYAKTKSGKISIRMNIEEWGETKHELSKGSPIYVIDGVMTNDSEFFLSLNPADLDKIKLLWSVEKRRVLGALGVNGVILVETKNPDVAPRIPTSHSLNLAGISSPIPFVQKAPGKDPRKPFLKPVLYWNPQLDFDAEGKRKISFSTSDDIGEFVIEVTGTDENGRPFFKRSAFTVTPGK